MDTDRVFKMVQQAASKIRGATRPVEIDARDPGLVSATTAFGFMADDAMGDPVSFIVAPVDDDLVLMAAYDGKLSETTGSANLSRERVRRITTMDIAYFAHNTLELLEEGMRLASVNEEIRTLLASAPYDYDFRSSR